jgi:hypothetical protein
MMMLVKTGMGKGIALREWNMMVMSYAGGSCCLTRTSQTSAAAFISRNLFDGIIFVGPAIQAFYEAMGLFSLKIHMMQD